MSTRRSTANVLFAPVFSAHSSLHWTRDAVIFRCLEFAAWCEHRVADIEVSEPVLGAVAIAHSAIVDYEDLAQLERTGLCIESYNCFAPMTARVRMAFSFASACVCSAAFGCGGGSDVCEPTDITRMDRGEQADQDYPRILNEKKSIIKELMNHPERMASGQPTARARGSPFC